MIFTSKLPLPPVPHSDVFSYIFKEGRRNYPRSRVLYRADQADEELTLGELEDKSCRLAGALRATYGISMDDVVAIYAKDKIQYPIAYFAALAAGATVTLIPVQKMAAADDIAGHLEQTEAKLLITDSDLLGQAEEVSTLLSGLPLITLDKGTFKWPSLDDILERRAFCADRIFKLNTYHEADQHRGFINRTSGSTGKMKCVLISHAHFIATMEGTKATIPPDTDPDRDVWLSPLSLGFFINAKLNMGLNILLGIPVVLMQSDLDAYTNIDVIQRHRITFLFITPPLAAKMASANMDEVDVSSVKWLLTAGAPMHENLRYKVSEQFRGIPLTLELGTAETMLVAIQFDEVSRKAGSTGALVSGTQAKVIDQHTGLECGVSEAGEVLIRNLLAQYKGYKDNPVANSAFDSDGWFHTGDYGYLDEDSNLYIVDRIKELIKTGGGYGSHVSAAEIEEVIFTHEAVSSVVVIGVRDYDSQLDCPTAFVVPRAGYGKDIRQVAQAIHSYANERLTGLKRLTGGVVCVPEFPMTGFKINRKVLKQMAAQS